MPRPFIFHFPLHRKSGTAHFKKIQDTPVVPWLPNIVATRWCTSVLLKTILPRLLLWCLQAGLLPTIILHHVLLNAVLPVTRPNSPAIWVTVAGPSSIIIAI